MPASIDSRISLLAALVCFSALCGPGGAHAEPPEEEPKADLRAAESSFQELASPLFESHCVECHGGEQKKAGLDLTSWEGLLAGGESGSAIVAGSRDESLLYEYVRDAVMPPEGPALAADDVERIGGWIDRLPPMSPHGLGVDQPRYADVVPILYRRCAMCHGARHQLGGLDVRTVDDLLQGGASGPAVVPGNPMESALVQRVELSECPPSDDIGEAGIEPMTAGELTVVRNWIEGGAPVSTEPALSSNDADLLVSPQDRQWWAFQPPARSAIPQVNNTGRVRNAIDAFVLVRLEEEGLGFSPEADRATLIRRVALDLTGLPPTPGEIEAFVQDPRPDAYERLVERLLASPRYGEKWARFWLDLAGYADSEGKRSADLIRPYAWRYRDYVIRAMDQDRPYDQFLLEQLAGDELVDYGSDIEPTPEIVESLVATGFMRMAPDGTSADPVNRFSDRIEVIDDQIDILGRGVMGLTLKCARCHSHKYDPIPQRDYYRVVALFRGAYDEYDWLTPQPFNNQWRLAERRHLQLPLAAERAEVERHNAEVQRRIDEVDERLQGEDLEDDRRRSLENQRKQLVDQRRELPRIRALWDRGEPSPAYIYRRGDETQPVETVQPGVPAVLLPPGEGLHIEPPDHSTPKTGRRLALARWLIRPDHPLTARVLVNRIWHQHFGTGIVESLDNFGRLGTPPSHPELLDWLAVEFVEQGWSLKDLHRSMVTSTTYRQSSALAPGIAARDPDNRLLSRMPMRRLSAEELRDSLLLVSGMLSEARFGEPDRVQVRNDGLVVAEPQPSGYRRSIYLRQRRKEMPTMLATFDLPQMIPNCSERVDSTIVSQPLYLWNNGRVYELATAFAGRVAADAGGAAEARVVYAWRWAYGRDPEEDEHRSAAQFLRELAEERASGGEPDEQHHQAALADFCHILLNSAEFLYID